MLNQAGQASSIQPVTNFGTPTATQTDPPLVIPQYAVGGGMGRGFNLTDNPPGHIKSWHVDHEWLRLNVPAHTGLRNLAIVTGFGPSMRPMFNPGDPLLVDTGVKVIDHERRPWLVPSWLENPAEGWQTPERLILLATIPHQVDPVGTGRRYVVNIELPRPLLDPLTPWTGGLPFVVVDRPDGIRVRIVRH